MILLIPVILATIYLGGIISQFIYNYEIWKYEQEFSNEFINPSLPSLSFSNCFAAIFYFPQGAIGLAGCMIIYVLLFLLLTRNNNGHGSLDKERNFLYSNLGTYGTSGFMDKKRISEVFNLSVGTKNINGTILGTFEGKIVSVPVESMINKNIAVYGAPGTMKSRAFARNMIFQCVKRGESLFITDPKSELCKDTAQYLKSNGYSVKIFNLVNHELSDSWECLGEIGGNEIMAQTFVDVIIKNTGSPKSDPFWDNATLNLLKALTLFVEQEHPPETKNIGEVYNMIIKYNQAELNKIFDMIPVSHPAKAPFEIFKQSSESVRGGVIVGLGSRLQVFQNKLIKEITGHKDIDLELMGQEKCAYFCITSDQDSTFDFLSSLIMSFLFIKLVRFADIKGKNGKLPVPVHILADEIANIVATQIAV